VVDTEAVARRVAASIGTEQIEMGALPAVWSDEASVTAVLQNLISNAIKFHRDDTPTHVVVSGVADNGYVHLCVDDDGIGIEPEYRERVFTMFARLHVREAYAGTGIGLAIVQQVAERADGRAWVEASERGGSRFCVTLPEAPLAGSAS
jgi:signal transduction histidine kinase